MSDKNWGEAIPALEQCIQVRPNYSAAYFALAQSLQQQEQFEKCRSVCVEGIADRDHQWRPARDQKSRRTQQFSSLLISFNFS